MQEVQLRPSRPGVALAGVALAVSSAAPRHTLAVSAAQAAGQGTLDAAPRVLVRAQPPQNAAAQRQLLDTLERYFEPTITTVTEPRRLEQIASSFCGHVDEEWLKRVKSRNKLTENVVATDTALTLPPCPFYSLGGAITLKEQDPDKVRAALLREVGIADAQTLARVASMNSTTPAVLEEMGAGRTLKVDFVTVPVSHVLKPQFTKSVATVVDALRAAPGTLSARPDIELSLVSEHPPGCDVEPPPERYPFDADAVAETLEFNLTKRKPRLATVGVIDTGIDKGESRLFLAAGFDGTIGKSVSPGSVEIFPTNALTYKNRGHGTHVAGLVLGGLRSPRLTALVRDRVQLKIINIVSHVVRVESSGLVETFPIPLSNLDAALGYAGEDPRLPILNLSVETTTRHEAMLRSFADGDYLAIVAAGNSKRDIGLEQSYPASWRTRMPERFISVAALLPDNTLAPFSNHGPEAVDLAAPGCGLRSLLPAAGEGTMSGTSQAAPLVTFTAALLYSEGLPPREVRNRIRASVNIVRPPLRDRLATMGILDVPKAISVHEDLVTMSNGDLKRGRLDSIGCIELLDDCWPIAKIVRLRAPAESASSALGWLQGDDGNVVVRSVTMPSGSVPITGRDGIQELLDFAGIAEIMFAVRKP